MSNTPEFHHKVTINIHDDLYEALREVAFDERTTMTEIICQAIERELNRRTRENGK